MRIRDFSWDGAEATAVAIRSWVGETGEPVEVEPIERLVRERGDDAVLELTARFDAPEAPPAGLAVESSECRQALSALDPALREAMEVAAANIRAVAEAQVDDAPRRLTLAQGQRVALRDIPVRAAGIYAPGGHAAYPSSVLMCAIPARVAGVDRIALSSPPGPDGRLSPLVLAAAALCEVDEVYSMGGAQAIFALALGTETVAPVDVISGPGNAWVREAKRAVYGRVGIDSLAGPSELMLVADTDTDPAWAALDLCAQAEHGAAGTLLATATDRSTLDAISAAVEGAAAEWPGVGDAPLALVELPNDSAAIELANAFAPEHLELLSAGAEVLAEGVITAGCVFIGAHSATAFGDYAAGSNHVLPTGGAGRFSGPLGPGAFRRTLATVEVPGESASKLAGTVDTLARAEGFPVHGESAMIRAESGR
jgi:histidinol dehydrogenase